MDLMEFLTGIATLFTAILVPLLLIIGKRKTDRIEQKTDQIHVLVNSRLTAVLDRVDQLTQALEEVDVPVPPEV